MATAVRVPRIECDEDLERELATHLQFALTGKQIFYSDTLIDLIDRHCPDIYERARARGFCFVPLSDKDDLAKRPPHVNFDIIRLNA